MADPIPNPPLSSHIGQRGVVIIVLDVLTTTITFLLVLLRLYVRSRVIHALNWDDFFIVLAMASTYPIDHAGCSRRLLQLIFICPLDNGFRSFGALCDFRALRTWATHT